MFKFDALPDDNSRLFFDHMNTVNADFFRKRSPGHVRFMGATTDRRSGIFTGRIYFAASDYNCNQVERILGGSREMPTDAAVNPLFRGADYAELLRRFDATASGAS